MSVPGNAEPGAFSGQQQQQPVNFSSAIPIKKRRFPVFQPCSPPRDEKPPVLEENLDSKKKEESNVQDATTSSSEVKDTASPVKPETTRTTSEVKDTASLVKPETTRTTSEVKDTASLVKPEATRTTSEVKDSASLVKPETTRTTSVIVLKKEVNPLKLANVDVLASKPVEENPGTSLGSLVDSGNKNVILQSSEPEVPMIAQAGGVKQEIVGGVHLSSGKMNVELSLGPKEAVVPALEHQKNEDVLRKSVKFDSLLSLALHEEKLVSGDKKADSAVDSVSNPVSSNRSNWDLNTTMDVWEGSTCSDAFSHGLVNMGRFNKTDSCHDEKSLLTIASAGFNKGKHVLESPTSGSSKSSTLQSKIDDSLGLKLAMPCVDSSKERSSLSDNVNVASVGPNLSLKQVQLSVVNAIRAVKSEPVDDNAKHDCSIGSSSSTNMESSKFSSVKRECASNHGLETKLQSSTSLEKSDDRISVKSEVVHEHQQEACKSTDAAMMSIARAVMQHQDSSASSSAMPVLLPQSRSPARLPTCSELTTSGDLSNQSEQSFHSKELQRNDVPGELGSSSVVDHEKFELGRIDEHTVELPQNDDAAEQGEENMDISDEMLEEDSSGSDTESKQKCVADTVCEKEDEEYEDGEVREHLPHSAEVEPVVEGKNNGKLELVRSDSSNLQPSAPSAGESISIPAFNEKNVVEENLDETRDLMKDNVGVCYEPNSEDNSLQESYEVSDVVGDEKRAITVTPSKQLDMSGEDVNGSASKEVSCDIPTDGSHGIGVENCGEAVAEVAKENCSGEDDSTLSKVEACLNGHDGAKDSNNAGNKSRIINLSRPSVTAVPFKPKSMSNRLLPSRNGKERYSDFDGEFQPRGNRDEFYNGGSNRFVKDRVHDQSVRNSRPAFMRGKGRNSNSGRFGSLHGEWNSDNNFASESSYGQSEYRGIRRKHAPSLSDVDLERNGYNMQQDDTSFGGNRRKTMNDEFHTRRGSLRRISSGDRDARRGFQMFHRIPRNMSPRRCSGEDGSDMIGLRNDDKFIQQHLSDDGMNLVYGQPQVMYDEFDNQIVRGNRNFSTNNLQRKNYPRNRIKSPVRSRTRSPGPWSSPRRRSPNGLSELAQHRSPVLYRMGRIRSPEHAFIHDDMVARRRGSPSYARHNNDMRDVDPGREHIHPRPTDSNRRDSQGQFFPRNTRRADAVDSREMGDGHEYLNGPSNPNKFHELRGGDGNIDDRRKFMERRGPPRSFRPNFNNDNGNFRFHQNDGPRPYRFCPDTETEFVDRSNGEEREFDGRIKHQPLAVPRRIRNIEEQQDDENYRPDERVERVWHDDGFTDARVKRRRF